MVEIRQVFEIADFTHISPGLAAEAKAIGRRSPSSRGLYQRSVLEHDAAGSNSRAKAATASAKPAAGALLPRPWQARRPIVSRGP